ncbi:50S ribosomal protein L29 [Deinococcus irradiatisoli]|uniref:Large ribosomal subunit protein uL29 n=1 Tax=Deinococcus irradiatisoli TaxID=2202254 RepID=A0A2Z3JAE8_9DEIO|nr:50S ribosomal protein L29 [Deinococcus irradiatisoli]AWN22087.1 50S ribosomal protein L29 [Deinococcus irradiatisoli]
MKLSELRAIDAASVQKEIATRKEELMKLRFQGAVGNLAQPHRVRELRKEVAQLLTLQGERQRAGGDK